MVVLKILKTKSDPNIHQNAPFKKNFLGGGGACPRTPLAIRMLLRDMQISQSEKNKLLLPLPNAGYAYVGIMLIYISYTITIFVTTC